MTRKVIVTRSQHSVGSSGGNFGGPDHYMAVVTVPYGVAFDGARTPLCADRLRKLGIRVQVIGEYYGAHVGPRSAYWRVLMQAMEMAGVERPGFGMSAARVL